MQVHNVVLKQTVLFSVPCKLAECNTEADLHHSILGPSPLITYGTHAITYVRCFFYNTNFFKQLFVCQSLSLFEYWSWQSAILCGELADLAQAGWASLARRRDVWMLCPLSGTAEHGGLCHVPGIGSVEGR